MDFNKLKVLRLQRKIQVKEMSKLTGMSRNLIHLIESGKSNTSHENIENYVKALGDIDIILAIRV